MYDEYIFFSSNLNEFVVWLYLWRSSLCLCLLYALLYIVYGGGGGVMWWGGVSTSYVGGLCFEFYFCE
jgi:hypothetical protein